MRKDEICNRTHKKSKFLPEITGKPSFFIEIIINQVILIMFLVTFVLLIKTFVQLCNILSTQLSVK